MPLGFGKSIFSRSAPAGGGGGGDFVLYETTLESSYLPRGYTGCKFAGLDSNGAPVFVFTLRGSDNQNYIKAGRLNTTTGGWTFGTVFKINTGQNGNNIPVATQAYGSPYKNSATLPNDYPQTSGTNTDAAGCFEVSVHARQNNSDTIAAYGIWVNNNTLTCSLRASSTGVYGMGTTASTGLDLTEHYSDNWIYAYNNSVSSPARYAKYEWNAGTSYSLRGSAIDVAATGFVPSTNLLQRKVITLYSPSGQGHIFTMKQGDTDTEFFMAHCGISSTGAWSGDNISTIYNYTGKGNLVNPTLAQLDTKTVIHGGVSTADNNFYHMASKWTYLNTGTVAQYDSNRGTAVNSSIESISAENGVMVIDRGDALNSGYILRLKNSTNKLQIIPFSVDSSTSAITRDTTQEVTTSTSYSEFGQHGGLAQFHPWYVALTHDGTDSKVLTLKYTGA